MTNIQKLLDKYWEGETSLDEEKILRDHFNHGKVSHEHEIFRDLFQYFEEQKDIKYEGEWTWQAPQSSQISKVGTGGGKSGILTLARRVIAVAALLTLVFSVVVLVKNQTFKSKENSYVYEVEDPEEALQITLKALAMVSGKLDKGTSTMMNGMQNVEKANILR